MFYTNKSLFFIILYFLSLFLGYFINQKFLLLGIFENFLILTLAINLCIILISFAMSLASAVIIKISADLIYRILKQEQKYNRKFVFWLGFTIFSYVAVFFIFLFSITY